MFVMRSATQPNTTAATSCSDNKFTHNFATINFVLLPGLEPGSKSLLPPPPQNEFLGLVDTENRKIETEMDRFLRKDMMEKGVKIEEAQDRHRLFQRPVS